MGVGSYAASPVLCAFYFTLTFYSYRLSGLAETSVTDPVFEIFLSTVIYLLKIIRKI